jgi:hypothetical protein
MPAFRVTMEMKRAGETTLTIFGADRDDVMEFVKKQYRKVCKKVTRCHKVKLQEGGHLLPGRDAAE